MGNSLPYIDMSTWIIVHMPKEANYNQSKKCSITNYQLTNYRC